MCLKNFECNLQMMKHPCKCFCATVNNIDITVDIEKCLCNTANQNFTCKLQCWPQTQNLEGHLFRVKKNQRVELTTYDQRGKLKTGDPSKIYKALLENMAIGCLWN